ncbi:hypothetical protein [Okeania sp. SIO3I5]|nr:hypothetical protein [Okeania sp. SIO3I5]
MLYSEAFKTNPVSGAFFITIYRILYPLNLVAIAPHNLSTKVSI